MVKGSYSVLFTSLLNLLMFLRIYKSFIQISEDNTLSRFEIPLNSLFKKNLIRIFSCAKVNEIFYTFVIVINCNKGKKYLFQDKK